MKTRNSKAAAAIILIAALIFTTSVPNAADAKTSYNKIYKKYAAKLQESAPFKTYYMAIVKAPKPVLLIADGGWEQDGNFYTYNCTAFQYYKKKVRVVCPVYGNGTAYPIAVKKKRIITGEHHACRRVKIKKAVASVEEITGSYMGNIGDCYYRTYKCKNLVKSNSKEKEISHEQADKKYFYKYDLKTAVKFKKVK